LSVSPFAVTAEPDVGDVFVAFGPSVELPLASVMPDCVWFFVPDLDDESLLIAPLVLAPPVVLAPLLMLEPPVVLAPLLMLELSLVEPLMLEPLLMLPLLVDEAVLSEAGATAPPTAVVSVVAFLSPLAHAATATRAATTAMCFTMKILRRIMNP
jgi:hypothetical protein